VPVESSVPSLPGQITKSGVTLANYSRSAGSRVRANSSVAASAVMASLIAKASCHLDNNFAQSGFASLGK